MSVNGVSQTATIGGLTFRVYGSSIDLQLSTIPRISFSFDVDANEGAPFVIVGQTIILTQTCDGVQTFSGRVSSVKAQRGNNFTRFNIEAFGLADLSKFRRHYGTFPAQSMASLLNTIWAPLGVTVNVAAGAPDVQEYGATYDSAFDITSFVVNSTGWQWTLENTTLNVFNPVENPVSRVLTMGDFHRGTLSTNASSDAMFNVARMQAYEYREIDFTDPVIYQLLPSVRFRSGIGVGAPWVTISPTYCTRHFTRPSRNPWDRNRVEATPLTDWEFIEAEPIRYNLAAGLNTTPKEDIDFSFDAESGRLEVSVEMLAYISLFKARFRRLVWVEVRRQESIDIYGEREAPTLTSNNGPGIEEGLQLLGEYLDQRAAPSLVVSGDFLYSDLSCGERVTLVMPELNASGDYIVYSVKRQINGDDLKMGVEFRKIAEAAAGRSPRIAAKPNPDIAPEIFKRLGKLETAAVDPRSGIGKVLVERGPIMGKSSFGAQIEMGGSFSYQLLTEGIGFDEGEI